MTPAGLTQDTPGERIGVFEAIPEEKMIREFVLQMKLGSVLTAYFRDKFGVDVLKRFEQPLRAQCERGYLSIEGDRIRSTREGLMRIDSLLHDYFLEEHQNARYT